ncbi:MAG TPA: ATP-binding protein [Bacteroidales bacterium]|jgi:AAA+ ATPase superfamily predicted ATPase|nr:ATP-binding protein [Bacteroidales bacterium]
MKSKISNPFVTTGYLGPEFFCDRKDETERILSAISSGRNITLISLRRMGKTGLLKHVKHKLEKSGNPESVIYVDLLPTLNGNDLLNSVSTSLLRIKTNEKNILEKVLGALGSLRPKLTIDSLTGQPSLELIIDSPTTIQSGFDKLLLLISDIKRDIVFMFDEFQQISRYPEKSIEQMLRTVIQTYPAIPFIFSGSSRHMLENMFLSAGRPFYQSSELMYLDQINENDYREFIKDHFIKAGRKITDEAIDGIFEWTRLHTYYVQYVCSLIYESGDIKTDLPDLKKVFLRILTDFEPQYISYRNLLPSHQFRLLRAIASENIVKNPTAGKFIADHNLTSPSSVSTSLNSLQEKEMIVRENGKWMVYDVFFSRWLEYNYSK